MAIGIDPTPPKGNWAEALPKAAKAISDTLSQKYLAAGKSAYDAVVALRTTQETPEQRAWTLWRESLGLALEDFFNNAHLYRRPYDEGEFQRLLSAILAQSAEMAMTECPTQ